MRDLLRGRTSLSDVDLVVEGIDPMTVGSAVAAVLHAPAPEPTPFLSVQVRGPLRVDVAHARRERYPRAGSDPQVEPATLEEDLSRRDFTINAIAWQLEPVIAPVDPRSGRGDLSSGLLRILHPNSFREDPARILRAARFAVRFGLVFERETLLAAREEAARGCNRLTAPRLRLELDAIAAEPDPAAIWARLAGAGLFGVLGLTAPPGPILRRALIASPSPGALWLAILAAQATPHEAVARFGFAAREANRADAVKAVARGGRAPLDAEGLASARLWRPNLSPSDLEAPPQVRGADLIQLGLSPGPQVGQVLERLREARERGQVSDLAAELELARRLVAATRGQTPEDPT